MTPWTERHRPKSFEDIKGQEEAIEKIKQFLENFNSGKIKKRALLLYGPPGIGKTSLVYVAGLEIKAEIFELNASDLRNKVKLQEILKPAMEQRSLFKENKIILVDEVDGISSVETGGLTELLNLIDISRFPLIITANDIWDSKFSGLRKKVDLVEYCVIKPRIKEQILKEEIRII